MPEEEFLKKFSVTNPFGQTLTEFCVVLSGAILICLGAAGLWISIWRKVQCSHRVFETTHRARIGLSFLAEKRGVRISTDRRFITGESRCGTALEKISLPTLRFYEREGR